MNEDIKNIKREKINNLYDKIRMMEYTIEKLVRKKYEALEQINKIKKEIH